MVRGNWGRTLITFVIVSGAIVSVVVDWSTTHLFNPEWVGHARFHAAAMLNLLCGVSVLGLWLIWRHSKEPDIGVKVAALIPVIFWSAFFYITWLVPGTSLNAGTEEPPLLAGIPVYPNVIIAGINIVLSSLGYWLYRRERLGSSGAD